MISPPFLAEWVQRYDSLRRSVGAVASTNQVLEDRLHGVMGEVRALTEQIKTNEESSRIERLRQLSERKRSLEEQLGAREARRAEETRMGELVDANRRLLHQMRQTRFRLRYCDRCGARLVASAVNSRVLRCPACDVPRAVLESVSALQYYPEQHYPQQYYSQYSSEQYYPQQYYPQRYYPEQYYSYPSSGTEAQGDSGHSGTMHAGHAWHGMSIHENCAYCSQQLTQTSDPNVNYCPYCGKYQLHSHGR
jgi:DNA-directed RNA polymerase subunit RPC12/RpoP